MGANLSDTAKELIDGRNFATVATINSSNGAPHASTMWITRDGDDLLFSITTTRKKYANLLADPRVSILVPKPDPQQGYVEVRGKAEITEQGGRDLINRLYNKYIGPGEYAWDPADAVRVVVRVTPEHIVQNDQ